MIDNLINALHPVGIIVLIHYAIAVVITLFLLSREREPLSTVLWIFLIFSFPVIGVITYWLLSVNRIPAPIALKRRTHALCDAQSNRALRFASRLNRYEERHRLKTPPTTTPSIITFNRMFNRAYTFEPLLTGNAITLLDQPEAAINQMVDAINHAAKHIHLSSFIISDDPAGRTLMQALHQAATRGVTVRVLYDAVGSFKSCLSGLFRRYPHPNLHVHPFAHKGRFWWLRQENTRNHRKLLIIDAEQAFTGGVNIHADYFAIPGHPPIRDHHFHLTGPIVATIQQTFIKDWIFTTGTPITATANLIAEITSPANQAIRLVNSGPTETDYDNANILFTGAIAAAQKSILIVTPYFIPTAEIKRALILAAYRGVTIKILVPKANNHPMIAAASRAYYKKLLKVGIRIFQRHPPFIHTKSLIVDDDLSIVGSANIDPRSMNLNYESNLVVYDSTFADQLKASLATDLAQSDELHYAAWRKRPKYIRIFENLCNLLHPNL